MRPVSALTAGRQSVVLVDLLTQRDLLPLERVEALRDRAGAEGIGLDRILLAEEVFTRNRLLQVLENHFFCPSVDLTREDVDRSTALKLPKVAARRHEALPIRETDQGLLVAMADPSDSATFDALGMALHRPILPRAALETDLRERLEEIWADLPDPAADDDPRARIASRPAREKSGPGILSVKRMHAPAPELVDGILEAAVRRDATDIHLRPGEDALNVQFRIDGILHTMARIPVESRAAVTSRVKVLANLDIAEHRIPQDGRIGADVAGEALDLRVSTLPSQFGENVVIRLLRRKTELLDLDNLHMPPAIREAHAEMLDAPQGFFLVTGPTGSGKTTTLYATLKAVDREHINVITLEDPIEVQLPGVTQVQIREESGLGFTEGLRAMLRQDPDVVLVGEIRDLATTEIACRAALTGHKVLSTIHTNDACQAVTRLLEMGTPPHLITATLRGVLAQRLLRRICPECKETYEANESERAMLGYPSESRIARGRGCSACAETGYQGRFAVFEYFRLEESLHRLILDRASPYAIRHAAQRSGMILMSDFARRAVLDHETTVQEVQRVVLSAEGREQLCGGCQRVISVEFSVCPFCQNVLRESCTGCGTALDPGWDACPTCGKTVEREWKKVYCQGCLAPVNPAWSTCRYCGTEIP